MGFLSSLFGGGKDEAADARNDAREAQYEYTIRNNQRTYDYAVQETLNNAQNIGDNIAFQNAEREKAYGFELALRAHNYKTQMKAWSKSEMLFKRNNQLIGLGERIAVESEHRWLEERFIEAAFTNMDLMLALQKTQWDSSILNAQNINKWNDRAGKAALANRNVLMELDQTVGRAQLEMMGIAINFNKAYKDALVQRKQTGIQYSDSLRRGQIENEANRIQLEERNADIAFQRQNLYVEGLRASGAASATGQVGRTAAKQVQSVVADIGRNEMVLYQAASTASDQFKNAAKQINSNLMTAGQRFNLENQNTRNQLQFAAETAVQNKNTLNQNIQFQYQQGYQKQLEIFQGLQIANYDFNITGAKIAGDLNYAQTETLLGRQKVARSLDSAMKQTAVNLKKIRLDKWQALVNNEANRMIKPEIPPAPPAPTPIPTPTLMLPFRPTDPPEPVYESERASGGGLLGGIARVAGAIVGKSNPVTGAVIGGIGSLL